MLLIQNLKNNIYLKKVLAVILILMICFSCFLPAPPADAAIVSTVIAVAATVAVGAMFIALGVLPGDDREAFDKAVSDCVDLLVAQGRITTTIALSVINNVAYMPVNTVHAIKDFLFDNGIVESGGQVSGYTNDYDGLITFNSFPENVDKWDAFITDNPEMYETLQNATYYCIVPYSNLNTSNVPDSLQIYYSNVDYQPYLYYYFMQQRFHYLLTNFNVELTSNQRNCFNTYQFNSSNVRPTHTGTGSPGMHFGWVEDGEFVPVPAVHMWTNVPTLGNGVISNLDLNVNPALDDESGIDEIYPDWASREQAYEQDNEDVIGVPLTVPDTYDDVLGLTQEQAWAGDIATSLQGVDTNVGTIADSMPGILENTGSIATSVADVASQVGSIADVFTGSIAVATPVEALAFGELFSKFPFNVPFELIGTFQSWVRDPDSPMITIPLPQYSGGEFGIYTYTKDIADIPNVPLAAAMVRGGWMLLFSIGMLKITAKVVEW